MQLRADLGLDKPFPVQFAAFVGNALQGEFGLSLRQGRKVSALIVERFPATVELAFGAALLALSFGRIPMGVYAALKRGNFLAQAMMAFSLLGVSLPTFLIGILLILFFAVTLKVLPSFGRGETVALGAWTSGLFTLDGWKHLILPAVTLAHLPAHADHAAGACRDARGAAHRLHQVRRAHAACPIARSTSAMR